MNVTTVFRHIDEHIRAEGVGGTLRWMLKRAQWRLHEQRYGIRTEGVIPMSELGIDNDEAGEYQPTDYTDFAKIMRALALEPSEHVFIDYGAGMGRVMVLAAGQGFRRVLGIEHSTELVEIAKANIEHARPKLKCHDIALIAGDAATYRLPQDTSVLYFNNSFRGELLERVLSNIRAFSMTAPRPVLVVCNLPFRSPFEEQIRRHDWLELEQEIALNDRRRCLIFTTGARH